VNQARLSLHTGGAFLHPLGDQTPIDCRYGETLQTEELPHRYHARVDMAQLVDFGRLVDPRAVIVWNLAGQRLLTMPSEEEKEHLAQQELLVGLVADAVGQINPLACQLLRPAEIGTGLGGNTILWLPPGARVVLAPRQAGCAIPARVLVIPGDRDG
jgi:hypothetical protein